MKTLFTIIGVCIVVIATILPNTASASYWNVTFTAERVTQVGMVDDGETIFQGDPDLFFAMQIYVQGSYQGNEVTQIFFQDSYVSTTDWNFQDKEVSLTNVWRNPEGRVLWLEETNILAQAKVSQVFDIEITKENNGTL